jgi:hypothetical protein
VSTSASSAAHRQRGVACIAAPADNCVAENYIEMRLYELVDDGVFCVGRLPYLEAVSTKLK